jgi:hypothetical protein
MAARERDPGEEPDRNYHRVLERVERESAGLSWSLLDRARRHFSAAEADQSDKAELWGRRIGRALSLIGVVVLLLLLLHQL